MTSQRSHWGILPSALVATDAVAATRRMESAGLDGVFATQVYGPPWIPLAAAATASSRLLLASGIAIAFTRSPFETAHAAMDLDRLSDGRFVLGLGPSIEGWVSSLYGSTYGRPLAHLAEVIGIVRTVVEHGHTGELVDWKGDFYDLDFSGYQGHLEPVRTRIPIWVAALREPMIRLSANLCDGLIGHPMWSPWWIANHVEPTLTDALGQGGRDRKEFDVNLWKWVAINTDRQEAIEDAKATVAFYASQAQYASYYAAHGFGDVAASLSVQVPEFGFRQCAHLVPEEMAQTFVVVGERQEVAEKLEPLWLTASSMCLTPPLGCPPDRHAAYRSEIADLQRLDAERGSM